jgi:hypothetical protein
MLVAVGLALLGVGLIWAALARPSPPDAAVAVAPSVQAPPASSAVPTPSAGRPSEREDEPDVRDRVEGLVLPESDPVAVSIPRIGARSRLIDLGLDSNREMEIPKDPADAGWFSRGATPGALGPAVIAGHVTWAGVRGVFYRLDTLRRGDEVLVTRDDGRIAVFTVTRVARFSKSRFPSQTVYGAIDHAGLRLVTCGGIYDTARTRYLDNVIVFARLTDVRGG